MEPMNSGSRYEEGELHVIRVEVDESEIRLTGTVYPAAEQQCRSDAINGLLGASTFSILPASELCSRNLVAVTVTDENGKPRLCRAVITDTSEVPKGSVRVLLVDECRPDVQVRLSHLYYCPKHVSAVKYPPTCQQFVLADVLPSEGRFKEIEAWLKWKLLDKTVGALFDLHVDSTSYICPLDEQKLPVAFSMLVEGLTKMVKNPLLSLSALSGKSHVKLESKERSISPPRPAYSQWKMPLGLKEEAQVLSMEKGPWMFCLQFKRQKEQVPSIREKLKILHLTGKLQTGELNIGDAVICPNKFHGGHSRGLITNKLPDNVYSVYYVDEGSKALIKEREIWLLPEEMAKIPLLVHRCRLDGIACTKDEDISKRFEVLVKDRKLIGSLENMGKDVETTANLFINENSILELLVCSFKKEILLDDCQVTISYVNEEKAIIFVVLSENAELLDKLHIAVQEAVHMAPPLSFPEKMQSCIAVFPDDECWYRATVLQTGNTVKVRYVDYGNEASLAKESLRTISHSLVELAPAQALPCILNNVDMKSVKAADISKVTDNDSLKVKIVRYTQVEGIGNVAVVELTTASSGISINKSIRDLTEEKDTNNNVDQSVGAFGIGLLLSQLKNRKDLHIPTNTESTPQEEVMQQMFLQQRFSHPPPTQSYQRPLKQPYHYEHRERRPYQGRLHQLEQQYSRNTHPSLYHYQQYNQPKNQLHSRPQRHFNEQHPFHLLPSQTVSTQTPCEEEESHTLLKRVRPEEGSLKFCRLTFEAGPLCFYLVQEENLEHVKAITQKLGEACKGIMPKCDAFNCGSFVAIKDKDVWHRAQVTYTQGSMFKVFMMDIGKEKCVQLYELKPLPEVLAKFPAQAIKCCLQNTKTQILKGKPCKLRELMDVQMVVHFISCKDHLWQVNLFSKIHPEEIHHMNGKPIPTSSDDNNVNEAGASNQTNGVTSTDTKMPYTSNSVVPRKVSNIPVNVDQDPCGNKALHSPLPRDTSEEQLASFSPVGITGRAVPGPFTSTTHLDLASNSLSPSAIPMDDTVSSTDSRSTVRHNISVEQEELNSVKPFTNKAPLDESEKGSEAKPCTTCGSGVGSVLQYIAKQNADKVINAALATHAHSQGRHDSETDTAAPQLASVKNLPISNENNIKAVGEQIIEDDAQDADKSKLEDESLLWDSRRGIACKGANLDKDNQPKSLITGGDASESLLWDSRIGIPNQKAVSTSNAAANESLVWDSKIGSNLNANESKIQDESKSLLDASESLLWDSRIGIPNQKVVSASNGAAPNESLVWDSKIGSNLNTNKSKIQDDSKFHADESLLWDSRRGRLGYTTERKLNGCQNHDLTKDESISEIESQDIKYSTEPQPSSVETSVTPVKNTQKETISLPPQKFEKLKLPLHTHVNVCVAYVSGLSVWVQLKDHLSDLNNMMDALNTQMENSRQGYDTNLSKGVQCISRYHLDEGWYRAVVTDVDESKKNVKVLYVDYGNTEQVDPEDIFVLPEKFQELPQQALHCCLPADFGDWLEPYQEKLEGLAGKCAMVSVEESSNEHMWTLSKLEVDGEDLVDLIKQSISVINVEEKIEELQDTEVDLKIDYPAQKMPLTDGERVYVSYLVEEVEVWLQKVKDVPSITDVSTHIAESETAPLKLDRTKENMPCLAQSAADGVWYRAMIMSLTEPDQFTVHFVDYGNSETVSIDQIREIPESLVSLPPLAYCCTLNDCKSPLEIGWKALEREFVDQELVVHVKNSGGDKVVVSLLLDEKDIVYDQEKPTQDEQEKEQKLGKEKVQTVNTKSRNWYAPIGSGEVAKTQSSDMLKSSPPSEGPECKDSSSATPTKSVNSAHGLTGVFMSFRKKDPIGLSKTDSPEVTSPISSEKGISSLERGPLVANRSLSCTKQSTKPSLFLTNNGIGLKSPLVGSTECSSNKICTPVNEYGSQLKEKQIEAEGSVTASTEGQKRPEESHKAHGKRFLDCIEEVEECSEGSSDVQINAYTAYLVHIEESPFSLWVQKEEENDLAEYIETWYKEHNQERAEDLKVDDMCVTVLGESAQRVRVQCVEDANVTVFLIDQGKRTVVSKQDLYKLPESLTDIPPLAKQIYLPVKVVPGRESGAVIAVAEVAHQSKCMCVDLDGRYTIVWCPGAENLADYLVDNKLASPITWEVGPMRRLMASAKRKLQEEAVLLETQNRQESSFYHTADTDLAAKLEHSLKVLNGITQAVD